MLHESFVLADLVLFFHAMLAAACIVEMKVGAHLDERMNLLMKYFSKESNFLVEDISD